MTKESTHITRALFICLLFNTGFLIMIAGADLSHQGISLIKFGYYTDFNQDWYFTNGDIMIVNMLINSVVPFVLILFIEFY